MSDFINNAMSSLKWVALAGGTFLGYKLLKKRFCKKKDDLNTPAPTFDDEKLACHLKPIIKHFTGCLNPLHHIVEDHDTSGANVLFDNLLQITDAHGDEFISNWIMFFFEGKDNWSSSIYEQKASELICIVLKCGMIKVEDNDTIWNESKLTYYRILSEIEDGQEYCVIEPYWILNDEVFEKGLITAK